MIRSIYTAVSGMITEEARQNVITNNLSNYDTNGFKTDNMSVKDFKEVMLSNHSGENNSAKVLGEISLGSQIDETSTDFTQGDISSTDSDTDFALEGRGFFTVNRNNGTSSKNYYTRDGHFHVNMQGYLVTDNGDNVIGKNINTGNEENIYVGTGKLTADASGNLSIDGRPAYSFALADFNDYKTLKKVGDNLYDGSNPIAAADVEVSQKALEKSNVNVTNQIVDMMSTMRNFETNQKVIQALDETLGQAVNDVGTVK